MSPPASPPPKSIASAEQPDDSNADAVRDATGSISIISDTCSVNCFPAGYPDGNVISTPPPD
jgi:hypothetical protein